MDRIVTFPRFDASHAGYAALAVASVILATEPLVWLVQSWLSAAYGTYGWVYAAAVLGLACYAWASGPARGSVPVASVLALAGAAAAIRLTGQVLAINVISACALAIDVYAIARALRLDARPRPVSPAWLAVLFLFALPLQTIVERLLGYPLQRVSTDLACGFMGLWRDDLVCHGTRLDVAGHAILVDLPCAGAAGLVLTLAVATGLNALHRPRLIIALLALSAVLALAVISNALRVTALAEGIARGWPVMEAPWHDATGLAALALTLGPLIWACRPVPAPLQQRRTQAEMPAKTLFFMGLLSVAGALTIVSLKARPVDVSKPLPALTMPAQLQGHLAEPQALSPLEERYFRAYGGQAAKVVYGPMTAIRVRTTSPLRHLHDPADCLAGMGYAVTFLGTQLDQGLPTTIYRAEGPDGDLWQVRVSFVSQSGQAEPAIGAAVWAWMTGPGEAWSSLQRVTPLAMPEAERAAWDAALIAALDITTPQEGRP